jgi:hypothetical protein
MEPLPGASGSEGFLNAFSRSFTYLLKVKKATFMKPQLETRET